MATRAQKVKVGLFLLLSTAMLALMLALIARFQAGERIVYEVVFPGSVLGLYEGGLVQYKGVEVGRVDGIRVGEDQRAHVRILIDPVKIDLKYNIRAQLEIYSLATGTMCVALFYPKPGEESHNDDPERPAKSPDEPILANPSIFESVGTNIAGLNDEIRSIIERLRDLIEGIDRDELNRAITNLGDVIGELKTGLEGMESGELTAILRDVKDVTAEIKTAFSGMEEGALADTVTNIDGIVAQIESGLAGMNEGEISALIADLRATTAHVQTGLEGMESGELTETVRDARQLIAKAGDAVDSASTKLEQTATSVQYSVDNLQHGLVRLLDTLERTLEAVRDLAQYLEQDPSALVRGKGRPQGGN